MSYGPLSVARSPRLFTPVALALAFIFVSPAPARAQLAVDGFNPGTNGFVNAVAVALDGKVYVGGSFSTLGGGTRSNFGRLNNDGTLDSGFVFDVNGAVYTIVNAISGELYVGGQFTSVTTLSGTTPCNGLMRLNPFDGTLDTCFSGGATGSLGIVNAIAVQRDGKVVVGGSFFLLAGQARSNIGRFNSDGTLDVSFNPGASASVFAAVVQQNGQIVIGGNFTQLGGPSASFPATSRNHIARLNADGSLDTSYNPGADDAVLTAALQNDGRIVVGGTFTKLGGGTGTTPRAAIGRINRDGSLDIPFDPGTDGSVRAVTQLPDGDILVGGTFTTLGGASRANLGRLTLNGTIAPFNSATNSTVQGIAALLDGRIVIGGLFTSVGPFTRNTLARLYDNGAVDATLNPGADASPAALALQLDGRILVGGDFTMMGNGGTLARNHLARLSPDGSVDAFNPGPTDAVWSLLVQPDGMIVVGGIFNSISSFPHSKLARLNAAGADDASFTPSANGRILALAIQSDQKILAGGEFTQFGGTGSVMSSRQRLVRLNPDGTVDLTFPTTVDEAVYGIAVQPDGKILIVGLFTTVFVPTGPVTRKYIARLNQDGTIDSSFNAFADGAVTGVSVQPDGTILVFGAFGKVNNISKSGIARLTDAGLFDASFTGGANGEITSIQVQADGNVIVGGSFTALTDAIGSTPRQYLGRFFSNGIVDATFDPGVDLPVRGLLLQPDGKLIVAGMFNTLGGNARARIGRLRGPASAAAQFIAVSPAGVVWFRLGATSQFSRVALSLSTNGTSFTPLGDPTPTFVGWNFASTSLPVNQNVFVRARGFTTQGYANASGSIVQGTQNAYVACPVIAPATIPAGRVGLPYSVSFSSSFALGIVTFTETGALPSGVTFVNGVLSGTPAQSGNFPITVDATDSWSGCIRSQAVTLAIAPPPTLSLSPVRVNFGAVRAATGAWISQTPAQTVTIVQNGSGVLSWTASANQPWLQVSPPSGVGGGALTVSIVNTGALPSSGAIAGAIIVATSDANYTLPVLLTILPGTNTGPIGSFDTPLNGQTGVTGSFAVTGWAVDDIGVSAVRVCRAAVAGETAGVQPLCGNRPEVFIGNATFVAGARPDIAASYPDLPYFDRAGWGYLLLSNFLPGQGNGPYVITTYAEDFDGHVTALGAKAINCSNATATAPFGAIDTPDQGGVMSGAGFPNFGWVLAAQPTASGRFIPFDGSTIQVFIDSVVVSTVDSYNNPRSDIQALFPGYANTDGAVGVKILDSTPIANGVHTIFWIAVDNFGAAAGIGSRFFTVSNSSVVAAASGTSSPPVAISTEGLSSAAMIVRYGFDANPRTEVVAPNADGVREVHAHQLERIAIDLRAHSDTEETTYRGYARVGDSLHALPIGSHLDERTGEFAWAPGLAFGGPHELVFIKTSAHGSERIDIRVVVR